MAACLDEDVRGAVDDLRLTGEAGFGVDEAREPDTTRHAVEVAAERRPGMGDEVQRAEPSRGLPLPDTEFAAELFR